MKLSQPSLFREQAFIAGQWLNADDGTTEPVRNPATGEALGTVPTMGAAETKRAIDAANKAFIAWRAQPAKARAVILRRWADLMIENQEDLAQILTAEQGKPLAEAKGEIAYAASFLEWFGEEGKRIYGDTIPQTKAGQRIVVLKEPISVAVNSFN